MDKLSIPNKMQSIEEVHKALKEIEMFVNNLSSSVATEAETETSDITGKTGDIQITQNADKSYTFEVRTEEGWKTPVIGETSVKFKDKPSDRSKPNNESIESITTEDESTGGSRANLNIFDEQNNKFVIARPDYNSGWVNLEDQDTPGTHPLETTPLFGIYQFSTDAGSTVQSGTMASQSGEHALLEVTSTTWKIIGSTYYGYWARGSGNYDLINYTGWTGGDSDEDTTNATIQIRVLLWK